MRPAISATTASESADHDRSASIDQSSNGRSVRATSAQSGAGSTHIIVPAPPKWPNVDGELVRPVQWGDLSPRTSKPSPHGHGSKRPTPGTIPARSGYCVRMASAAVSACTSRGRCSSARKRAMSSTERPDGVGRRAAAARRRPSPAARTRRRRGSRRTASRRALGDVLGRQLDAGVGVDAPPLGRRPPARRPRTGSRRRGRAGGAACTPAGRPASSSATMPSSTATSVAHAASGLVSEASRNGRSVSPVVPTTVAVGGDDGRGGVGDRPRRDGVEGAHRRRPTDAPSA